MYASQQTLEFASFSPVSKIRKLKAQYELLMHDTKILIKKKKYKKTYYSLERFLQTVNNIDFLDGKEKLKMNFRIFYVLEKIIRNMLTKKEVQKGQNIKEIEQINLRMTDAFIAFNEIYSSMLRDEQLRNTLESNKSLISLVNHEDAIAKLFCMTLQLYINNYFLENLKNQLFLAVKYLIEAKEFMKTVYTLNNSHLLEKDIYITTLLGNFYTENGLHNKAIEILQEGIKSVIMLLRYRYIEPNPSLDTEDEEEETNIWKQRRFQRSVKLIITFLYSFAYVYEKIWKLEHAFEALQLARYLGRHVLFDNTDEFKRYLIHIEHELDSRYSKIVQETLEIESIVTKELEQNKKWYEMAQMLKEQKQEDRQTKNMYDEELYQKHNVKRLNQSKTITVKKQDVDSFKNFYSSITSKKKHSRSSSMANTTSGEGRTSNEKTSNTDKRDRATTTTTTTMSPFINHLNPNDTRYYSPTQKWNTDTVDESIKPPLSIQLKKISENNSKNISAGEGSNNDSFSHQRFRNNTHSLSNRDASATSLSNTLNPTNENKSRSNSHQTYTFSKNSNNNNTYSFSNINNNNSNNNKNNNSRNNNNNNLNITNILNNLNNSKSSDKVKNQNFFDNNINQDEKRNKNCKDDVADEQDTTNNRKLIDSNRIDIWGLDQNQEKAPSYNIKKVQSNQSLTQHHNGNHEISSFGEGKQPQNIPPLMNGSIVNGNGSESNNNLLNSQRINRGESANSLWSIRRDQSQALPSQNARNRAVSNSIYDTPKEKKLSSNQNSKGSYNINYGRMSIRIQDVSNHEHFGALSNLLLTDHLEKLDEDSNTQEGNSNIMFDSPSSSQSTLSIGQKNDIKGEKSQFESKQFRSKTLNNHPISNVPLSSSQNIGDDKFNSKFSKGGSASDSKRKEYELEQERNIFGQSAAMTNFDTQNFEMQKKDITNLDFYLSQHIYKALQKSFVSKSYQKIKTEVNDWKRKDDLQRKNLLFGKKMLKFRMKEDLIRPTMRKLDSSAIKNISSYRQMINLNALQDTTILETQDKMKNQKEDLQVKKNQMMQRLNETRDSQSNISDYDNDQNMSLLFDSSNKRDGLREIILKHRSIFPLTRVRKLLKDRKKEMMKKQQQEILKNRIRQSITSNTNNEILSFVNSKKQENSQIIQSSQPTKVRFANYPSSMLDEEDTVKEDQQVKEENTQNEDGQKYFLRNKELLHDMIEDYETEKEKELRMNNKKRMRVFSSDSGLLQKRDTSQNKDKAPQKAQQLYNLKQLHFYLFHFLKKQVILDFDSIFKNNILFEKLSDDYDIDGIRRFRQLMKQT